MRDTARAFGQSLRDDWKWQKGDVLSIFATNDVDYMPCVLGAVFAGGVVSPANPTYTVEELAYLLKDSEAKAIATQLAFFPTARKAAQLVGIPDDRIFLFGEQTDPSGSVKHFRDMRSSRQQQRLKLQPDDLTYLVYSSGTTGLPKGVMLSHTNIMANLLQLKHSVGHNLSWQNDKILGILPFFHIYGLTVLIHYALYRGIELVVMPRFDLEGFCSAVQSHKITCSFVAPPVLVQLSRGEVVKKYDLSSVRMLTSGAAPLTRELVESVFKRLGIRTCQAYGMSEASPGTHLLVSPTISTSYYLPTCQRQSERSSEG